MPLWSCHGSAERAETLRGNERHPQETTCACCVGPVVTTCSVQRAALAGAGRGLWALGMLPPNLRCVHARSKVYSSSTDGTILAWNASTLRVTDRFQLPGGRLSSISLHDGCLWCCKSSGPCCPRAPGRGDGT